MRDYIILQPLDTIYGFNWVGFSKHLVQLNIYYVMTLDADILPSPFGHDFSLES